MQCKDESMSMDYGFKLKKLIKLWKLQYKKSRSKLDKQILMQYSRIAIGAIVLLLYILFSNNCQSMFITFHLFT